MLEMQDFAVRLLRSHIETGRLSHAYLFTGQNTPKAELALAFAAAVNCEKKRSFTDCDCGSCHKLANQNHPDVKVLGEDLKLKSIKIEEIRKAIEEASFKPYEAKWKVFIILQAGRMTADASNALLKTLEEPPPHTLFVLTGESKMQFLETIQSRCFELRLKPESAGMTEISVLSFSDKKWEDFFEEQAAGQKDEIKTTLDGLIGFLRRQIEQGSEAPAAVRRLKALDAVLETKDALDSNVNPKLAMTRLAAVFRRLSPEKAAV